MAVVQGQRIALLLWATVLWASLAVRAEAPSSPVGDEFDADSLRRWTVTRQGCARLDDGRLVVDGPCQIERTFEVDLGRASALHVRVPEARGLHNLSWSIAGRGQVFLRDEGPADKSDVLAPELSGMQRVTLVLGVTQGARISLDFVRFVATPDSAFTPEARSGRDGQLSVHVPLDARELARWHLSGALRAEVHAGRLVFDGHGTAQRTFVIDPSELPLLRLEFTRANAVYNIGVVAGAGPRADFMRAQQPLLREAAFAPADAESPPARGKVKVTIDAIFVGGRYELGALALLGTPRPPGPAPPVEAAALAPRARASADDLRRAHYLDTGDLSVAIWTSSGCIARAWDPQGAPVLAFSCDVYRVLPRVGNERTVSEALDRTLAEKVDEKTGRIELEAVNPGLPGTRIYKSYAPGAQRGTLEKRVRFVGQRSLNGVLYWESVVNLEPSFRAGGMYANTDYHPRDRAFFPAEAVRTELSRTDREQVLFYRRATDQTLGHQRILVDDEPVGPQCRMPGRESNPVTFTPWGWRFIALVDHPAPGHDASAVVQLALVAGDLTHYHRAVIEAQRARGVNQVSAPPWVRQVKGFGPPPSLNAELRAWNALLDEGYGVRVLMNVLDISDYPNEGTWSPTWGFPGQTGSARELKAELARQRGAASRLKLGVYAIFHSVRTDSAILREHPDWFVRTRVGAYALDEHRMVPRLYTSAHVAWLKERSAALMQTFSTDFFYLDGGGFGGTQVDWPTLRVVQPTRGSMLAARNTIVAPDKPAWFNASNGLYGWDNAMSFYEGFVAVDDWRAMSLRLLELKLYQQPNTWAMPLYYSNAEAQRYANYVTLLGLKPAVDIARPFLPLINTTYELHPMTIQEVGLRPRWHADGGELEAYALGFGRDEFVISLLSHRSGKASPKFQVEFDPARTDIAPGREVYVYTLSPKPMASALLNRLSEPEDRASYLLSGWAPIALPARSAVRTFPSIEAAASQAVEVAGERTAQLVVSPTPAMIWSVKGHRKYLPMARTRWGEVQGRRTDGGLSLRVRCSAACEVAGVVPAGFKALRASVDGRAIAYRRAIPDLVIVSVPSGEHTLELRPAPDAPALPSDELELIAPERAQVGEAITLELRLAHAASRDLRVFVNVSDDATPVYTSHALRIGRGQRVLRHELSIPESIQPGRFELRAVVEGAPAFARRTLAVAAPDIAYPAGWDAPDSAVEEVTEPTREAFGFRILRSFKRVCNAQGSYEARVSGAELTLDVIAGEARVAGCAQVALEFESLRELHTAVSFQPPPERESFDADPRSQVSFFVDYHTPRGYARRVYYDASRARPEHAPVSLPRWGVFGAEGAPNPEIQRSDYRGFFMNTPALQWDLAQAAPDGWDGRVLVGLTSRLAAPGTRLFLRLKPRSKYTRTQFLAGAKVGQPVRWHNVAYRTVDPLVSGSGSAELDAGEMVLRARAQKPTDYSLARMLAEDMFATTFAAVTSGTTFLVADYLSPEGPEKRVVFMLSGRGSAELRSLLSRLDTPPALARTTQIVDLRERVAQAAHSFEVGFARYAPDDWEEKWGKRLLLQAGAAGRGSSLDLRLLFSDSFRRF